MDFASLLSRMNDVYEAVRALPWSAHALVALAMAGGLTLWLTGRALLKPLMVAFCAILGAAAGLAVLPGTGEGSLSAPQGLGAGLIIGIIGGLLLYRSAMAIAFGVVMAALVPLASAAYFDYRGERATESTASTVESARDEARDQFARALDSVEAGSEAWGVSLVTLRAPLPRPDRLDSPAAKPDDSHPDSKPAEHELPAATPESIDRFFTAAADEAGERWERRTPAQRTIISGAAVVGGIAGIALGLLMPAWGASAVSSMFGAAVWIPCFVWLSAAFAAPWKDQLTRAPLDWLIIWGGASLLGMTVQWTGILKRGKKAAA